MKHTGLKREHARVTVLPTATRRSDPWREGEPSLSDVIQDPIVQLVMQRDHIGPSEVWAAVFDARLKLRSRLCLGWQLCA